LLPAWLLLISPASGRADFDRLPGAFHTLTIVVLDSATSDSLPARCSVID
jgi:hypothetical protein